MTKQPGVRKLVHDPAQLSQEYVQWAENLKDAPGVSFGIPVVDKIVIPFHPGDMVVFCGRPGHAKCFAAGTMVLTHYGTTKAVEDVKIGDRLMGPDSQPRSVISLASGEDEMYEVVPVKGASYTVNSDHILTLQLSGYNSWPTGTIVNLTVKEYLAKSRKFKSKAKTYRTGVGFPQWPVPVEPYYLGVWLGDGTKGQTSITSADTPIIEYLRGYAKRIGKRFSEVAHVGNCATYNIVGIKGALNPIRQNLRRLGVFDTKDFIPYIYRANSRQVRLEVLAGLIDSDGTYCRHSLSITQKGKRLAEDIAFLCRSLGLAAYIAKQECKCGQTGAIGTYYRISISGELSEIPTRLARKQVPPRKQCKSVLRTGITVHPVGRGKYYGFQVVGADDRFLLADFTVVHNSSMLVYLARTEAKRIVARGKQKTECVVFVTWEQVTEEITAMMSTTDTYSVSDIAWGRVEIEEVRHQAVHRKLLPIWVIGKSLATGLDTPRMFPETVFDAIKLIKTERGISPTLLLFDYIQLIPVRSQNDRAKQVIEATVRCKEMAQRLACPVAVAVQARREVDDRVIKIPTLRDPQWSSALEQTADKFFSLWRPWVTEPHDEPIPLGGQLLDVTEELLVLAMCKQRFFTMTHIWPLYFQPQWLRLCAMETAIEERFLGRRE